MAFKITYSEDSKLDKCLHQAINDLDSFFQINWNYHRPNIFLVQSRETINRLVQEDTPQWWVGWSEGKNIFLLDKGSYESESDHRYSEEEYLLLMKHELVHCFCNVLFPSFQKPLWLREGMAVFLSGQHMNRRRPLQFVGFTDRFDETGKQVYGESGFAVKLLFEGFGRKKLLELVEAAQSTNDKGQFNQRFKEIYGFEATLSAFNTLLDNDR